VQARERESNYTVRVAQVPRQGGRTNLKLVRFRNWVRRRGGTYVNMVQVVFLVHIMGIARKLELGRELDRGRNGEEIQCQITYLVV